MLLVAVGCSVVPGLPAGGGAVETTGGVVTEGEAAEVLLGQDQRPV